MKDYINRKCGGFALTTLSLPFFSLATVLSVSVASILSVNSLV